MERQIRLWQELQDGWPAALRSAEEFDADPQQLRLFEAAVEG